MLGRPATIVAAVIVSALLIGAQGGRAEVILQYFETPWREIEARMPEIAAAGYDALWLPPPTKGTEGERDVGFAVYDRFDLGDRDQRGTVATRYGTRDDVVSLVETAHRFGVRVYFDVVMNHNGNPNGIENVGVSLEPVDLDAFPGTSVWDFHVLPARPASGGTCATGGTACVWCAWQPTAAVDEDFHGAVFAGRQWRVVDDEGALLGGGAEVCIKPEGGEGRVDAMPMAEALLDDGAPDESLWPAAYTHVVRAPRMSTFDDFGFPVSNWALLGLHDIATEQYEDGVGPLAIDGLNAVNGVALPRFVRDPDRPETYQYEDDPNAHDEDVREYLMRWIRWLMLETGADGFRLDAIKHIWPNFFGSDFEGDSIAFVEVIQDTFDEMHGFTDADDADLVDDAAVFGEDFTGSCAALKPYIDTGMRALDFPLFFDLGDLVWGGDIGRYSANNLCDEPSVGAFHGLNKRSGIAFAQSHDECQKHQSPDIDADSSTFSRCDDLGAGKADLVYAFILTREADATVFFDGNNWTPMSFVRSGRPDALLEVAGGVALPTLTTLVGAARRVARGEMQNQWVGSDGYVYERAVDGAGAAGVVVLNDRNADITWGGPGSTENSFIVTSFPPGTTLCELTGNALEFASGCIAVLDPAAQVAAGEGEQVERAVESFTASRGAPPADGFGLLYAGLPGGSERNYAVYAPPALAPPIGVATGAGADDIVEVRDVDVSALTPGVHALHVRFRREIAGAADAQDEVVVPLCIPSASGDAAVCGAALAGAGEPGADDPVARGLVRVLVDASEGGDEAPRRAVATAPARELPDGAAVEAARAFHVLVEGDAIDVVVATGLALALDDVAVRIDDQPGAVPGLVLTSTGERFLDGFTRLYPPGEGPLDAGPGEGEGEEGEGEGPDGGPVDPEGDDDGDGVKNADDNCVDDPNEAQEDFDEDGVGDVCDLCLLESGAVDATGCRPVDDDERARIRAIALAIAQRKPPTDDTDVNGDGALDVLDLDAAIAEAHE